jgi:hypothetical protein
LDEGTQDYIRDLLRQLNEARRDLDRAQTNQVVIRDQLTNVDTKAASKIFRPCLSSAISSHPPL